MSFASFWVRGAPRRFQSCVAGLLVGLILCTAALADPERLPVDIQAAIDAKDHPRACELLKQFLQKNPTHALALFQLGIEEQILGHFQAAIDDYSASLRSKPDSALTYSTRSSCYADIQDEAHALADARRAVEIAPDNYAAQEELAMVLGQWKHWDDAIRACNRLDELHPHDPKVLARRAGIYVEKKAYAEAVEDVDEGLLVDANDAQLYSLKARLYIELGDYKSAVDPLEQTIRLKPKDAGFLNNIAWFLATCPDKSLQQPARSVELAGRACAQNPRVCAWVDTQAAAFAANGDFDLAVKSARFAASLAEDADDRTGCEERLRLYEKKQAYIDLPDTKAIGWDRLRFESFDTVWRTVNDEYFDPKVAGANWEKIREEYRIAISNVQNEEQLRDTLERMVMELHRSHFAIIPRSAAVFRPEERVREGTSGVHLDLVDGKIFVASVDAKSAGELAHLKPGDRIVEAMGQNLDTMLATLLKSGLTAAKAGLYIKQGIDAQLLGPVGSPVPLAIADPSGKTRHVEIKPKSFDGVWSEPAGNFPSQPIEIETRRDRDGIAYVHFSVFALPVMKPLKNFIRSLRPSDGLIIDLRGNPGGQIAIAAGLAGYLFRDECSLGLVQLRTERMPLDVYPQEHAFLGPIAVLVDGGSASTSEVFASGLRGTGRARIFGEPTAGAALPSLFRELPSGDLFQYAIGDLRTIDGTLLEGAGVQPDVVMHRTREDLNHHRDTVLDAARAWLRTAKGRP